MNRDPELEAADDEADDRRNHVPEIEGRPSEWARRCPDVSPELGSGSGRVRYKLGF